MTRLFAAQAAEDGASISAALLAGAVRAVWRLEALPETALGPLGKPFFPSHPALHFNLSHSGPYAFCALSDVPVGVDVERLRPRRVALVKRALSEEESAWYVSRGRRWEDFYTLWTCKEARVKCLGTGLIQAPASISGPLLESGAAATLDGLVFTTYAGEGYRAALCSPTDTAALEWFTFS